MLSLLLIIFYCSGLMPELELELEVELEMEVENIERTAVIVGC